MLPWDIVVVLICIVLIEYQHGKIKYNLLSPTIIVSMSLIVVYILPLILAHYGYGDTRISFLEFSAYIKLITYLRIFVYSWITIMVIENYYHKIDIKKEEKCLPKPFSIAFVLTIFMLFMLTYIISLGIGVGFSPSEMIKRLLNPRAYTYIKSGYGPILYASTSMKMVMLYIAIQRMAERLVFSRIAFALLIIILFVLGGSKASLITVFTFTYTLMTKYGRIKTSQNILKLVLTVVLVSTILFISFMYFYQPGMKLTPQKTILALMDYQQEAYYSSRVLNDFTWKPDYLKSGIFDTIIAPLPRSMFPEKPFTSFYNRYWQPIYQPNSALYHTSTYGILAEGHMMFGYAGPVIYAIIIALYCRFVNKQLSLNESHYALFASCYVSYYLYYFIRAGILSYTFWMMAIVLLSGRIIFFLTT